MESPFPFPNHIIGASNGLSTDPNASQSDDTDEFFANIVDNLFDDCFANGLDWLSGVGSTKDPIEPIHLMDESETNKMGLFDGAPSEMMFFPAPAPVPLFELDGITQSTGPPTPSRNDLLRFYLHTPSNSTLLSSARRSFIEQERGLQPVKLENTGTFALKSYELDQDEISFAEKEKKKKRSFKNKQQYTGVTYQPSSNRYRARIKIDGKTTHLGYFDSAVEAAQAYDRAAYELRGKEAKLNFQQLCPKSLKDQMPNFFPSLTQKQRCVIAARSVVNLTDT